MTRVAFMLVMRISETGPCQFVATDENADVTWCSRVPRPDPAGRRRGRRFNRPDRPVRAAISDGGTRVRAILRTRSSERRADLTCANAELMLVGTWGCLGVYGLIDPPKMILSVAERAVLGDVG